MDTRIGPLFARYQQTAIPDLVKDESAMKVGERLYASYCTTCHGSDARGARGFPNLRDNDWLWGGDPQSIVTTITDGRIAAMPAWEGPLGGASGVDEVAQYVLSLAGRSTITELAEKGKARFDIFCVACHGPTGTGNTALGAPNLTDDTWLYGGSLTRISQSIAKGRNGQMPAQGEFLGAAKIHLLAAYVYGLSQEK
jgi:cytochrome c oxidase cbb3-type subunit 3